MFKIILSFFDYIGNKTLALLNNLGNIGVFLYRAIYTIFTTKPKIKKIFYQMNFIGVKSLSIIVLIGAAVGAIMAVQTYEGLRQYGAEKFMGSIIFLAMTREFGPVLTAIMVVGRAGSAMTAEIGTMRITEQIDALKTLCININQYLIVPRIIGTTLILPFLSIFCSLCGILSGYCVSVYVLGINSEVYMEAIRTFIEIPDITNGLIKATVFGFLLSTIATYKGYITRGGAKGVGIATTESVVFANVTIFVADYILSSLLMTN